MLSCFSHVTPKLCLNYVDYKQRTFQFKKTKQFCWKYTEKYITADNIIYSFDNKMHNEKTIY
jgi:hypothetical protein